MAEILVTEMDGRFSVTVNEGASVSLHDVGASSDDLERLGVPDQDPRAVVEESFRYLLEREPKEAILARFDLPVIADYFGDYPDEIRRRMSGAID